MFSAAWNRIPARYRIAIPLGLAVAGAMGVLLWQGAWWLTVVGLVLAGLDLALGRHDNHGDRERRADRPQQDAGPG